MKIYRGANIVLDLGYAPDGKERKNLTSHTVEFSFELIEYLKLEKGDRINFNGEDLSLNKDYIPQINKATNGYKYELTFYSITERFKDFKLKYSLQGVDELEFKLTTSGDKFLDVVIYTLGKHGLGTFSKGQFPTEIKEIHFENIDVFSALEQIAETYELEWWVDRNVINLGKCEYGTPILLRYDTELDDISFSQSSEKLITRLYAFGGTRNIPANYRTESGSVDNIGERKLRLPVGTDYIDLFPDLPTNQIVEGVKIFEEIYPKQNNKIVSVDTKVYAGNGTDKQDTTAFIIKGDNTFEISKNEIESGKPLMIAFTSGHLNGREFELIVPNDNSNKFEIKYSQEGNVVIPNDTLKPQTGDSFFFFNFKADVVLPTIIPQAETELLVQAKTFIDKLGSEYVYDVKTRSIWCEKNNVDLQLGQIVTIQSDTIGSVTSRVQSYEKDLYNKFEATYQVGDYSKYSRLKQIEDENKEKVGNSDLDKAKEVIKDLKDILDNQQIGSVNLLRNAGFLGDYQTIPLDSEAALTDASLLYNKALAYWNSVGDNIIIDEPKAKSSKAVELNGSISQKINVISGEYYVFSVCGLGNITVGFAGMSYKMNLYGEQAIKLYSELSGDVDFYIQGEDVNIYNPQLERGTVKTDFGFHPFDENPAFERLKAYDYLLSAITQGNTTVLNGLILSTAIMLGNYENGVLKKVTSGFSGIYNTDDDPAVWAGGTMEMAIRTVQRFISNPDYQPTEEEWADMAKIVFTHGGDGFFRGYIYALGGIFRGRIETSVSGNRIIIDPKDKSLKMFNVAGKIALAMEFNEHPMGFNDARINVFTYNDKGEVMYNTQMLPTGVSIMYTSQNEGVFIVNKTTVNPREISLLGYTSDGEEYNEQYKFEVRDNTIGGGSLRIRTTGMPTSSSGLMSGEWYMDGGVIKVKQ